jgi:outer membrane receptor protein involved in Fe transport
LPVNGCDPDAFGFEKPHLGATTGGLFSGLVGAGLVGDRIGVRGFEAPPWRLPDMHTDFEPEYYNDEDTWLGQVQYAFDQYTVTVQGGVQESQFMSRQDYLMDVGANLFATPANPTGYWPTSETSGRYGAGFSNPRCNWNDGTAGIFGGCNAADTTRVIRLRPGRRRVRELDRGSAGSVELRRSGQLPGRCQPGQLQVERRQLLRERQHAGSRGSLWRTPARLPAVVSDDVRLDWRSGWFAGELDSTSYFGEVYWQLTDTVKITAGLRYNDDERKTSSTGILYNSVNSDVFSPFRMARLLRSEYWPAVDPDFRTNFIADREAGGTNWTRLTNFLPVAWEIRRPLLKGWRCTTGFPKPSGTRQQQRRHTARSVSPSTLGYRSCQDSMKRGHLTGSPTKVDFQETTGRIGADWQWSDSSMLYGFFTRGYKPGGFNPPINPEFQATSAFSFESEQVDAFEIGSKNMLFDNTLMLNGSCSTTITATCRFPASPTTPR